MRLLIYGGSFNPPHLGHAQALEAAAAALAPDRSIVIPAAMPPHKALAEGSPEAAERLELCRLAFAGVAGAAVSDLELRREGQSYTVDTLRALAEENPGAELYFLLGTDMLLYMEQWHDFREVFRLCVLAALPRNAGELPEVEAQAALLRERYGARVTVIPAPPLPMDSTALRADLPRRRGRERLAEAVYERIIRRRLYGARPELDWLRERALEHVPPERRVHVLGCEQQAALLAKRWGEDPTDAAEAAILHDITKALPAPEQLRVCEKYGIMADALERAEPSLLHARTGACLARELFGVPDGIYDAIAWHNTGRPGMSRLEKILWLADFTEPTRAFPGVERIRALCMEDLDAALAQALRLTLEHVEQKGRLPHPRTEETLQWLREEGRKRMSESKDPKGREQRKGAAPGPGSGRTRRRAWRVAGIAAGALMALLVIGLAAYAIWSRAPEVSDQGLKVQLTPTPSPSPEAVSPSPSASPTPSPTPEERKPQRLEDVYTLLLVGRDQVGLNTDTIMVIRMDCRNKTVNVVSIPRDTLVNVPWAVKKANSIYGSLGIEGLVSGVEDLVGFHIDNYAVVNTGVFRQAIDQIGGVYFDVPMYMYYDDPWQGLHIYLTPGYQLLNGYQAEQLVRFRQNNDGTGYPNGDLGRIDTQHAFFAALAKQVLSLGNISNLPGLIELVLNNTDTNLTSGNMAFYAEEFLKMNGESVSFLTLPFDQVEIRGGSYVSIQLGPWLEMINACLNPFDMDVTAENLNVITYGGAGFSSTTGALPDYYSFYDYSQLG